MDEGTKNRVEKKLAEYFVKKEFIRKSGINFELQVLDTPEMARIRKEIGVSEAEIKEFAKFLVQQDMDRYNFKNR